MFFAVGLCPRDLTNCLFDYNRLYSAVLYVLFSIIDLSEGKPHEVLQLRF